MRRRTGTPSVVMAFVDTLTCGLSAFLMLWLALTSAPAPSTGSGVAGREFRIALEERAPAGFVLGLRFQIGHQIFEPGELDRLTNGQARVVLPPDGQRQYVLSCNRSYQPNEADELIVYLNDLGPNLPATALKLEVTADRTETRSPPSTLDGEKNPALRVGLADLLENAEPVWRSVP